MRRALLPILIALLIAPAAAGQPATARDVLRAHVEAAGGEAAFRALTNRLAVGEVTVDTPMGPIILQVEQQVVFPGYALIRQSAITAPPEVPADMMKQTVYLYPGGGWVEAAQLGGRMDIDDLPEAQASGLRQQRRSLESSSDELALLDADSVEVTLGEPDSLDGVGVYVVEVGGEYPSRRMYAQDTGLLVATETTTPMGVVTQRYLDYRTVSGIRVPFGMEINQAGQSITVSFSELVLDGDLTPESIREAAEGS